MDLLTIDPRKLHPNPDNPRKSQAGELPDEQLVANIKEIGIIQPPVVRAEDDEFVIVAGHRRVRAAITAGFEEILVLVRDTADGADKLRAVSENVVRANLGPVDQWRAIEALVSDHWTEEAIATALALPVRTIKKLRLLAHIHPPMLDFIAKGDMPKEQELRTITAASGKEQASVWKIHKPKKGQDSVYWHAIANALSKRRMLALHAAFGEDERQAFGITWEDDLFAPADEDSRYTTNVDAFLAAQTAWLESHLPKKAVILPTGDYGEPKLPPKAIKLWGKPSAGDGIGKYLDPRTGEIHEVAYRLRRPEPKKGANSPASEDDGDLPIKNTRPDITQKGQAMIGDFRTEALLKALLEDPIEDSDLIGLLVTAFGASNVDVRLGGYEAQNKRKTLVAQIAEDGHITKDLALLRTAAREMLATILSCRTQYHSSGAAARVAGDTINADIHLPNMATDEFLSCCSKTNLESIAADLALTSQARAKDTRAAIIAHIDKGHFTHPRAKFALTEDELASLRHIPFDPALEDDDPDAEIEPDDATSEDGSSHDTADMDPDGDPIEQISDDEDDDEASPSDATALVAHEQESTRKQKKTRTGKPR